MISNIKQTFDCFFNVFKYLLPLQRSQKCIDFLDFWKGIELLKQFEDDSTIILSPIQKHYPTLSLSPLGSDSSAKNEFGRRLTKIWSHIYAIVVKKLVRQSKITRKTYMSGKLYLDSHARNDQNNFYLCLFKREFYSNVQFLQQFAVEQLFYQHWFSQDSINPHRLKKLFPSKFVSKYFL